MEFSKIFMLLLCVVKTVRTSTQYQELLFDTASPSSSNESVAVCLNRVICEPLSYQSDNGEMVNIHITKSPIDEGAYGEFYIGFIGENHKLNAISTNKCVGVKKIDKNHIEKYSNSVLVLNWMQKNMHPNQRKHIIEIFDTGYEHIDDAYIIVMELGEETLRDRIYDGDRIYSIEEMTLKVVLPLYELHKVAMHLDVKPGNYVFVAHENDSLKLIDFDGADLLIDPSDKSGDQCKVPNVTVHTMSYMSPEQCVNIFKGCLKLSVKADIWAIGIMLYEIILQNRYYDYYFSKQEDLSVSDVVHSIGNLYRGFIITENPYDFELIEFGNDEWMDQQNNNYYLTIIHILRVIIDYPLIFHLISNTLNFDADQRMSSKGILDFLWGDCYPPNILQLRNIDSIPFFHGITFGRIRRKIVERMDESVMRLFGRLEERQRKAIIELRGRQRQCETVNMLMLMNQQQGSHEHNRNSSIGGGGGQQEDQLKLKLVQSPPPQSNSCEQKKSPSDKMQRGIRKVKRWFKKGSDRAMSKPKSGKRAKKGKQTVDGEAEHPLLGKFDKI